MIAFCLRDVDFLLSTIVFFFDPAPRTARLLRFELEREMRDFLDVLFLLVYSIYMCSEIISQCKGASRFSDCIFLNTVDSNQEVMVLCLSMRGQASELRTKCFVKETNSFILCGVFEGQCGVESANFASQFLKSYLNYNLKKVLLNPSEVVEKKITKLLENAFQKCQQQMLISSGKDAFMKTSCSACIALALKSGGNLYTANCGDTLAFIIDQKGERRCVSELHTLKNPLEKIGIIESGGWYSNGLICDKTHLTRALGNLWQVRTLRWHKSNNLYHYDRDMQDWTPSRLANLQRDAPPAWSIKPEPYVNTIQLSPDDCFVSIQTAGMTELLGPETSFLWDKVAESSISKIIRRRIDTTTAHSPSIIAFSLSGDRKNQYLASNKSEESIEEDGRLSAVQRGCIETQL